MPGNIIKINEFAEFYVGDSKMLELYKWLFVNGFPHNKEAKLFKMQKLKSESKEKK